jgi:hypothetical protein
VSETRLADLELLLEQRAEQVDDLQEQRSALQQSSAEAQSQVQALQLKLQMQQQQAYQERATQELFGG